MARRVFEGSYAMWSRMHRQPGGLGSQEASHLFGEPVEPDLEGVAPFGVVAEVFGVIRA